MEISIHVFLEPGKHSILTQFFFVFSIYSHVPMYEDMTNYKQTHTTCEAKSKSTIYKRLDLLFGCVGKLSIQCTKSQKVRITQSLHITIGMKGNNSKICLSHENLKSAGDYIICM